MKEATRQAENIVLRCIAQKMELIDFIIRHENNKERAQHFAQVSDELNGMYQSIKKYQMFMNQGKAQK